MKQNWTYKKLTDICDIQYGYPFDSACFSTTPEDGMPLIRIRDVMVGCSNTFYKGDYPKEYTIHKGDYLIGMDGEFNIAPWKSGDALLNQRVCKISSKSNEVSIGYLYRFLTKELKKIEDETPFVTVKHLSAKRLNQVLLPVPSIETQSRIVSELDLLQSIIDKQKAQLAELDNLAQCIFYDMFGDILESTPTKCLKDVAEYYIGLTYSPNDVADKGTVVLRSSNIQSNVLDFEDTVRVNMTITDKKIVQDGDILMCARNGSARLVGKVARIKNLSEKMSFGAFMTTIRSPYNDYLFQFFLSHYFRNQLTTSKTATINQITTKMLDGIKLNVPSLKLQQSFAQKVESIERQKELINQSIREAQTLFDSRMEYYFGE